MSKGRSGINEKAHKLEYGESKTGEKMVCCTCDHMSYGRQVCSVIGCKIEALNRCLAWKNKWGDDWTISVTLKGEKVLLKINSTENGEILNTEVNPRNVENNILLNFEDCIRKYGSPNILKNDSKNTFQFDKIKAFCKKLSVQVK